MRWARQNPGVPEMAGWVDRPGLAEVIAVAAEELGVDPSLWIPGRRVAATERALVVWVCVRVYGYRGKELADALGYRSSSSMQVALERGEGTPKLGRAAKRLGRGVRERWEG